MSGSIFGQVPQIQVPDFAASAARAQGMQANRLAMMLQQRQMDEADQRQQFFAQNAQGFASPDAGKRMNLLAQMMQQPGLAQMAMPQMQALRYQMELDGPSGGAAPVVQPAGQPVAGGAPAGGGSGMAVSVPADLEPIIREEAARAGIPYDVAVRMIRQESNFNPAARGRAGEVGLMQIMPSTARDPGWGMPGVDPATLSDPRANVRFGLDYFSRRARARGVSDWNDPAQRANAYRAYNGGGDPNYVQNVERWQVPGQSGGAARGDTIPTSSGDIIPAQTAGGAPGAPAQATLQRTPSGRIIVPGFNMDRVERAFRQPGNPMAAAEVERYERGVQQHMQALQLERRGESEPLEIVEGPNGPEYRTRSQAAGMRPGSRETAPRSAERLQQDLELAERGAARSTTTVNAGDRRTDVLIADAWKASEDTAVAAGRRAALLGRAEQAMGTFQPGVLAERRLWLGQMARELGIRTPSTSEGEVLQQVQRQLELAATPAGQGSITENERGLIRQAVPVLLSTPEGARQAIAMLRALDNYEMRIASIYRQNARANGGQPNAVSVREEIARFVSENQPPDVQAIIETLSGPVTGGVQADPPAGVPAPPRGFRIVQ